MAGRFTSTFPVNNRKKFFSPLLADPTGTERNSCSKLQARLPFTPPPWLLLDAMADGDQWSRWVGSNPDLETGTPLPAGALEWGLGFRLRRALRTVAQGDFEQGDVFLAKNFFSADTAV